MQKDFSLSGNVSPKLRSRPRPLHHQAGEGQEDDEIKELFMLGKKRKKNEGSPHEIALRVEHVIAELEVAAEEDADINRQGKPAINKLKKLPLLTEVLSKKQLQQEFLDRGVLTVLKTWLEPLPDGSLPCIDIRTAILRILNDFPIDLEQYDRRNQLKKSGLGKVIMFLSKSDEEIIVNRKLAKDLVDKWSRPIFNKSTRFEDMRNAEDGRVPSRRPSVKRPANKDAGMEYRDSDLDFELSRPRSGQSSSGQHVSRPEATPFNFVIHPQSKIVPGEIRAQARQTAQDQQRKKQIHTLVMSLSYTGIEIKTAQSLESWSGGVLVMVSGSVQMKDYNCRRKFMQTFFLAPQEKGFFVLNDIFHFVEEDPIHQHQAVMLAQSNLDSKLNTSSQINMPVSTYLLGGDIQAREFVPTNEVKENGVVDSYGFSDQQMQRGPDSEHIREDNTAEESNASLQSPPNAVQDHVPTSEEPAGEPQKHTYASILRVAKGQSTPSVASHKNVSSSEWDHAPQTSSQQTTASSNALPETDAVEEAPAAEDADEIKSVYVRNLLPMVSPSEIEEEFKNFGKIRPDGVVIRSRKDLGVCYAFVEFEDISGVHNAVKAGSVQIAGRQVYIEERRPNTNVSSRGGRRGRGRGSYQSDAPRGRFNSRSFGRRSGHDGGDREYNKPRVNGFYRPSPRQERGYSGNQDSRNGQNLAES